MGTTVFSWDEEKNKRNQRKHGISFEAAKLVFEDPLHISRQDRTEDGERRWQTIGMAATWPCCWWRTPGKTLKATASTFVSSRRDVQPSWRGRFMSKIPKSIRKELAALAAKPEAEIDFSDVPATSERDWRGAERGKFYRPVKRQLTVRIDADVIEWLKSQGRGYQSRLNQILRAAMLAKLRHR
jgi:uncharacterized protein (DUF4415 family)